MAALSDPMAAGPQIVNIRDLSGRELDPLLLEETVEWQSLLDWDFGRAADLVHQFADMRALLGVALLDRGEVAGYGYSVLEEHKGLVGDVYVRPPWRNGANEVRIFRAVLDGLIATPAVARVECQLMLLNPSIGRAVQRERFIKTHERMLMKLDSASTAGFETGAASRDFHIVPWAEHHHEAAAEVIALAYDGHVDSQINDQYRTTTGARRFIYNIVQFPGCGAFFRQGSFVALYPGTGRMAGVSLVSFVGGQVGHITQLCVIPAAKGRGLGYQLLRESVNALRMHGARRISLTVTCANEEAIRLYARCGFRDVRHFLSVVWERG
jgi:ribosomal protein S18 acetylase RimI-like enzyme